MNVWNIVDSSLVDEDREYQEKRKAKDSWWPSEALGCRRRAYYDLTIGRDQGKAMDILGLYRTKAGNVLHSWFFAAVANSGAFDWVEEEWAFRTPVDGLEMPVSGRQDVRGQLKGSSTVTVIDLKTSFGQNIRNIRQAGWQSIQPHYLGQMLCYLAFGSASEVILAFLGRDDQYRCQFTLTLDDDGRVMVDGNRSRVAVESVIGRWKDVEKALQEKNAPERDFRAAIRDGEIVRFFQRQGKKFSSDWQCRYCPYNEHCWSEDLAKYRNGVNQEAFNDV
jgi:hypothetical protein